MFILFFSLTDMFLSAGTDISVRRQIFLFYSVINISSLLIFIFLSDGIAKSQKIVAHLASVIGSGWGLFYNPIFYSIHKLYLLIRVFHISVS